MILCHGGSKALLMVGSRQSHFYWQSLGYLRIVQLTKAGLTKNLKAIAYLLRRCRL